MGFNLMEITTGAYAWIHSIKLAVNHRKAMQTLINSSLFTLMATKILHNVVATLYTVNLKVVTILEELQHCRDAV